MTLFSISMESQLTYRLVTVPLNRNESFKDNIIEINLENCTEGDKLILSSMEATKNMTTRKGTEQAFVIGFAGEYTPNSSCVTLDLVEP